MNRQTIHVKALQRMGNVLECEGDYDASEVALQRALTKAETLAQRASILNDIAWVMLRKGEVDHAQQLGKQALQLCDALEDSDRLRAQIFDHLGTIAEQQGDVAQSLQLHRQSLTIKERLSDTFGILESANNLGAVNQTIGNYQEAMQEFEMCFQLSSQVGYTLGTAMATLNIGLIHNNLMNLDHAIEHYNNALTQFQSIGHRQGTALCLGNLGTAYQMRHDHQQARNYLDQALSLYTALSDEEGQADVRVWRAQNMLETHYLDDAQAEAALALNIAQNAQSIEQTAYAHRALARIFAAQSQFDLAVNAYQAAQQLFEQVNNTTEIRSLSSEMQELENKKGP